MTEIAKYFSKKAVVFLDATTRDEALAQLVDALDSAKKLKDKQAFHDAILAREALVSTGIGMGVAIPHSKLPGYSDFFIAVGIQKGDGIPWDALDGQPVRIIFMIGGPENKQSEYLGILSRLTTAIKNADRRKHVLQAEDAKQLLNVLRDL
jgi:nitrogen PTS system EIIA component